MQKKLIALAVAGAFAAPAFAATSNVDIYGKMHFSVSFYNDQVDTAEDMQFSSNASRIGFKGSEDLGGGLSAIWQVESTVNLDEGGGWGSGRNTFVGLKGNWGTVLGGKHDTPLKLVGRSIDLFGDTVADSRNVMGGGSDTRSDNTVAYLSPDFTGFSFAAAYVNDLGTASSIGDTEDRSAWNLSAQYKNGPFMIAGAYGDGDAHEVLGLGEHWRVAASFDMGDFRIVGQYDNLSEDGTTAGDYDAWLIGGQYKMGAWVFKGNYMDGDWDDSTSDPSQWTIGVDYNLSKRTTVYALYADGENITFGKGAGNADQIAPDDEDISVISVGITHTF
jgi:predicted porin